MRPSTNVEKITKREKFVPEKVPERGCPETALSGVFAIIFWHARAPRCLVIERPHVQIHFPAIDDHPGIRKRVPERPDP